MSVHAARAKFWLFSILLAVVALAPDWACAGDRLGLHRPFDAIVVFGDSLSDPGNAFALTGENLSPPTYGMDTPEELLTLVPARPYAKGGNHFSNGPTWIEDLGRAIGHAASVRPAFAMNSRGTNYAVGGATARVDGSFHLAVQVDAYLADVRGRASPDALHVVALGGNDVRDALRLGGDPTVIAAAIGSIAEHIQMLHAAGARKFLVWNAPNIALTPAVRAVAAASPGVPVLAAAEQLSLAFKQNLDATLAALSALPGIEIVPFDAFTELNQIAAQPAKFGLQDVTTACIQPNVPPFHCRRPDRHLFWDGIHPTRAAHAITAVLVGKALLSGLLLDD